MHHWYMLWLGAEQVTIYYLNQWLSCLLTFICIDRPSWGNLLAHEHFSQMPVNINQVLKCFKEWLNSSRQLSHLNIFQGFHCDFNGVRSGLVASNEIHLSTVFHFVLKTVLLTFSFCKRGCTVSQKPWYFIFTFQIVLYFCLVLLCSPFP